MIPGRERSDRLRRTGALWMLSPLSVVPSAPLWVVGLVVNEPAAFLGATALLTTFVVSTLGYAVMAVIMFAADHVLAIRRLTGLKAVVVVAIVIVVAAEARLGVVLAGFDLGGLPDHVPLPVRALSSALLALVSSGFAGAALAAWATYRDERDRLLLELLRATRRIDGHEAAVTAMSSVLREKIRGRLAEARPAIARELDALRVALVAGEDGRRQLERVNSVADSRWRAISKDAWRHVTPESQRGGLLEFAWAYATTRPFSLPGVLLGASALTFFVFARTQESGDAASSLAVWLALAVVVAISTNLLVTRFPRGALPVVLLAYAILLSYPLWLLALGVIDPRAIELLIRIAVVNVHVVAVLILEGVSPAIACNREAVLASLRRRRDRMSVDQLQLESRLLGVAHDVAATLHGASRSAFMAEALRLEAALDRGDRDAAIALVDDLRVTILEAEHSVDQATRPVETSDIVEVIENWRSVCSVEVRGSWSDIPAALLPAAHTVVVEGISDAMRHGDCSRIEIAVRRLPAGVELTMTNDGEPVDPLAPPGLGTALLDQLAPERWSRGPDRDGRTVLVVSLIERDGL